MSQSFKLCIFYYKSTCYYSGLILHIVQGGRCFLIPPVCCGWSVLCPVWSSLFLRLLAGTLFIVLVCIVLKQITLFLSKKKLWNERLETFHTEKWINKTIYLQTQRKIDQLVQQYICYIFKLLRNDFLYSPEILKYYQVVYILSIVPKCFW